MSNIAYAQAELKKAFSDYDQTVDVVSCWHALVDAGSEFQTFHRFPKFAPGELTPDFAITRGESESHLGRQADIGSLVCDIKRFPNPYKDESKPGGDFRPYARSVEQLRRYATDLNLITGTAPTLRFREHDVVLLTKSNLVDMVYKYLSECGIPKPFNIGRPLVLVEYTYDAADQQERYVFRWKQGENNSPFSHGELRNRMVDRAQPMMVTPRMFIPSKLRHVICNDSPPPIYVLVFLWLEILPGLLDAKQYTAVQDRPGRVVLNIRTSPATVIAYVRGKYKVPIKTGVLRECFRLLEKMKKAYRVPGTLSEDYDIAYSSLIARARSGTGDPAVDKRREGREYANIFANLIATAEQPPQVSSSKNARSGSGQLTLFPA